MADSFEEDSFEPDDRPRIEGGAGGVGGSDTTPPKSIPKRTKTGTLSDFLKSWANSAALEAGPQIEGGMAAVMQDAKNLFEGNPLNPDVTPLDAYRAVRDMGKEEHRAAEGTAMGNIAKLPGMLSTPIPTKAKPNATVAQRAWQGAKVGAPVGALSAAAQSPIDLTQSHPLEEYAQFLAETGTGFVGGGLLGAGAGATVGAIERPARDVARKLPMDMLGVGEAHRRAMQRSGVYDQAGDDLLALVRPFRSGMRKGSLTDDALAELQKRGQHLGDVEAALDAKTGGRTVHPGSMATEVLRGTKPYLEGSLQDKQVASRMGKEAENLLASLGDEPVPLSKAEEFKQRFGPGVAKLLKHAGEPAAKTTALGETYRSLKNANEAAAHRISPELAAKFRAAKESYSRLAAPLEGANVERSGMRGSDFDWGEILANSPAPDSALSQLTKNSALAAAVKAPLDIAGRAYGRGLAANAAEFLANRAAKNTGGGVAGMTSAETLAPWARFIVDEEQPQ